MWMTSSMFNKKDSKFMEKFVKYFGLILQILQSIQYVLERQQEDKKQK